MNDDFLKYQAQTSTTPLALEVDKANGSYIYDINGLKYLDFIAGISANTFGHQHPKIIEAIKSQVDTYLHVMVYGEFIQKPQVELSKYLANKLPKKLSSVYLTNSGAEAIEGAISASYQLIRRSRWETCRQRASRDCL